MEILAAGDARRKKIDDVQAKIAELEAKARAIAEADVDREELARRCARQAHDMLAGTRGDARIRRLRQPGPPVSIVERHDQETDIIALVTRLLGEQTVAERLLALASDGYEPGLPAAERAKQIAELKVRIRELAITEEIEARRIEAAGNVFVLRRSVQTLDLDCILEAWETAAT